MPDTQTLVLDLDNYYEVNFGDFLRRCRFQHLRRLRIGELVMSLSAAVSFFRAHPSLEEIDVESDWGEEAQDGNNIPPEPSRNIALSEVILPNLCRLGMGPTWATILSNEHTPIEDL